MAEKTEREPFEDEKVQKMLSEAGVHPLFAHAGRAIWDMVKAHPLGMAMTGAEFMRWLLLRASLPTWIFWQDTPALTDAEKKRAIPVVGLDAQFQSNALGEMNNFRVQVYNNIKMSPFLPLIFFENVIGRLATPILAQTDPPSLPPMPFWEAISEMIAWSVVDSSGKIWALKDPSLSQWRVRLYRNDVLQMDVTFDSREAAQAAYDDWIAWCVKGCMEQGYCHCQGAGPYYVWWEPMKKYVWKADMWQYYKGEWTHYSGPGIFPTREGAQAWIDQQKILCEGDCQGKPREMCTCSGTIEEVPVYKRGAKLNELKFWALAIAFGSGSAITADKFPEVLKGIGEILKGFGEIIPG